MDEMNEKKDETNIEQIEKEIQQDEVKKTEELKDEVKKEVESVKETVKEEVKKELSAEQKLADIEKQLKSTQENNTQLAKQLSETNEKIDALPAQRKGFVNQENPLHSDEQKQPTDEEIIQLIEANKDGQEVEMYKKMLGL